mmetsp:Transcript_10162/g.17701  ORF Transcript_10162/g.17701 Transcript_10162/m.17701 type:complete len:151 (-) Transcript_10162:510-962(-)|eukprot:CAMPEP_0119109054 /NCGR_PEP_ID=MMETSP1180-20130426/17018_1 /TAXON_ID=3052 ORGANISM="Chlamydomonas cf sp, Strain CCMP681" /NCGR_SAMPLE_ID=MMETSP1180 /ASSEMBLY_ACC=CAM_ASM_000741 /LENGTH=150 /DNA_ID=CAMNT_0007094757 /DNA_START=44 /DNA_END=496 /DNA_ORIENTATION=+
MLKACQTKCQLRSSAASSQKRPVRLAGQRLVVASVQRDGEVQGSVPEPISLAMLMTLTTSVPAWAEEVAAPAAAAEIAAPATVALPTYLFGMNAVELGALLAPIVVYGAFTLFRNTVNPKASFSDALLIGATLVILGNILSIVFLKVRFF